MTLPKLLLPITVVLLFLIDSDRLYNEYRQAGRSLESVAAGGPPINYSISPSTLGMTIVLVLVLAATVYIRRSKRYDKADLRWAYAALALVLGYWWGA